MVKEVSPTAATTYYALGHLGDANIAVRQDRCIMVRNRNAGCAKCADACTSGCIAYQNGSLIVNKDKCIGCGTCATVCPTCAIEALNPSDSELMNHAVNAGIKNGRIVVAACENVLQNAGIDIQYDDPQAPWVQVVCLGRIDESFLAGMAEHGMKRVLLVHGMCETCEHKTGFEVVQRVCETTNTLLEAWNVRFPVELIDEFPKGYASESLRDGKHQNAEKPCQKEPLLAQEQTGSLPSGSQEKPHYLKVMADGTLPHFIPDRRERLLNSLAALGEPKDAVLATRLWGHVEIDTQKCNSCRMCATFCPTGAISKYSCADGSIGLEHYAGDCVKCLCCQNICRPQALQVEDTVTTTDIVGGEAVKIPLNPVAILKGTPAGMAQSMRALLGMEEVFDR